MNFRLPFVAILLTLACIKPHKAEDFGYAPQSIKHALVPQEIDVLEPENATILKFHSQPDEDGAILVISFCIHSISGVDPRTWPVHIVDVTEMKPKPDLNFKTTPDQEGESL